VTNFTELCSSINRALRIIQTTGLHGRPSHKLKDCATLAFSLADHLYEFAAACDAEAKSQRRSKDVG
jgi:hypothetical protein